MRFRIRTGWDAPAGQAQPCGAAGRNILGRSLRINGFFSALAALPAGRMRCPRKPPKCKRRAAKPAGYRDFDRHGPMAVRPACWPPTGASATAQARQYGLGRHGCHATGAKELTARLHTGLTQAERIAKGFHEQCRNSHLVTPVENPVGRFGPRLQLYRWLPKETRTKWVYFRASQQCDCANSNKTFGARQIHAKFARFCRVKGLFTHQN